MERGHEEGGVTPTMIGIPSEADSATEAIWKERRNRLAIIQITPRLLWKLLKQEGMPEHFEYAGAAYDYASDTFKVKVRADEFPKKDDSLPIPVLHLKLTVGEDNQNKWDYSIPIHSNDARYAYLQGYEVGLKSIAGEGTK